VGLDVVSEDPTKKLRSEERFHLNRQVRDCVATTQRVSKIAFSMLTAGCSLVTVP